MTKLFKYSSKYYIDEYSFEVDGKQFETRLIGRIIYPIAQTPGIQETVINVAGLLVSLYAIFTFKTAWVIVGLIGCGITGFNVVDIYKKFKNPMYLVMINMKPDTEIISLTFNNRESAVEFSNILENQREIAIREYEN